MYRYTFHVLYWLCFVLLLINCAIFAEKQNYAFDVRYSNLFAAFFVLFSMIVQTFNYKRSNKYK